MKTYPILNQDGMLRAFEISSSQLTFGPIYRALRSVARVENIKRNWFNEDRLTFSYRGVPFVVNEPWGDNSRYWIGPAVASVEMDVAELHDAFKSQPAWALW